MIIVCAVILIAVSSVTLGDGLILPRIVSRSMSRSMNANMELNIDSLGLTPVLREHAETFHEISDNMMRYEQLLYMAGNCPLIKKKFKVPENKVPGCLSTVYVHAERSKDGKIIYTADADAQMTKGLVTLLVEGLTNNFPCDIEKVDPAFIDYAGIGSSLTSGRNNGFLNMLALMKSQAQKLDIKPPSAVSIQTEVNTEKDNEERPSTASIGCAPALQSTESQEKKATAPMHQSILSKLQTLQPTTLTVENVSAQHKNHPGKGSHSTTTSSNRETNFNVHIVAECFADLSLVERHKMVYALLAHELQNGLHALSIVAKTPSET